MTTAIAASAATAPAAGVSGSSPAPQSTPVVGAPSDAAKPMLARVREAVERMRTAREAPADGAAAADAAKAPAAGAAAADAAKAPAAVEEPETVPMGAFKERIGKLNSRVDALRQELHDKGLEAARATAAAKLLQEALNKVRDQHASGAAFDDRDDQILNQDLTTKAQAEFNRIVAEGAEALKQQAEEIKAAQAKEAYYSSYDQEIKAATAAFPLVGRDELIQLMLREVSKAQPASAKALAEVVHSQRLAAARGLMGAQAPALPHTARVPGTSQAPARFANDRKGMLDWVRANKTQ